MTYTQKAICRKLHRSGSHIHIFGGRVYYDNIRTEYPPYVINKMIESGLLYRVKEHQKIYALSAHGAECVESMMVRKSI